MAKVQEVNGQHLVTIPKEKVLEMGIKKGDTLLMNVDRRTGELILTPAP